MDETKTHIPFKVGDIFRSKPSSSISYSYEILYVFEDGLNYRVKIMAHSDQSTAITGVSHNEIIGSCYLESQRESALSYLEEMENLQRD